MEKAFQRFILTHYGMPISTIGSVEFPDRITHQNEEIDLVALIPPSSMLFGNADGRGALLIPMCPGSWPPVRTLPPRAMGSFSC